MPTVLLSVWENHALVNLNFKLDFGSFNLRFQFYFGISSEIAKFPMNPQNSALEISATITANKTQKSQLGLILKN